MKTKCNPYEYYNFLSDPEFKADCKKDQDLFEQNNKSSLETTDKQKLERIEQILINEYDDYTAPLWLSNAEVLSFIHGYESLREKLLEIL